VTRICRASAALFVLASLALLPACRDVPTAPSLPSFTQTDLRAGTGAEAVSGTVVTVHYTGWLFDPDRPEQKGAQFETSAGRDAFMFFLGGGVVIQGWDQGLVGMRVGGLRRLVIPPSLAYGRVRSGPIPPNATLLFEIELLEVQHLDTQ
jgi:FKBP-type peptidyl-prolyl cis-trans isomerase FkpA